MCSLAPGILFSWVNGCEFELRQELKSFCQSRVQLDQSNTPSCILACKAFFFTEPRR